MIRYIAQCMTRYMAALLVVMSAFTAVAGAQTGRAPGTARRTADVAAAVDSRALTVLDGWIVARFRGAQLLPDTGLSLANAGSAAYPRIESVRIGERVDTLFALDFTSRATDAALPHSGASRLAASAGTISTLVPTLLSRRPFRAPRVPNASNVRDEDWRHGWAYLAVMPAARQTISRGTLRGWMLLDAPPAPVVRK